MTVLILLAHVLMDITETDARINRQLVITIHVKMVENVSLMEKNINAPALLCFLATNVNLVASTPENFSMLLIMSLSHALTGYVNSLVRIRRIPTTHDQLSVFVRLAIVDGILEKLPVQVLFLALLQHHPLQKKLKLQLRKK